MTTVTVFLHTPDTLRVSFAYSAAMVEAIKTVEGATWNALSRTWRVPLAKLDRLLAVFGDDCAVAPEVFLAASPVLPAEHFANTCHAAGVTLHVQGERVVGSGGCWTPILQAEIDKRAVQLRRLIAAGWITAGPALPEPVQPAPKPTTLDLITEVDRLIAKHEGRWRAKEERKEGLRNDAIRRRMRKAVRQADEWQSGLYDAGE